MKPVARVILVAALVCGFGCTHPDWIDRTLVTVDVTGTWEGTAANAQGSSWFQFTLEQEGSQVKGAVRGWALTGPQPLVGVVSGDALTFKVGDGRFDGELTVAGDEMNGQAHAPYLFTRSTMQLRRVVNSPSRPVSPEPR
jgi:hypothetical protein